MVLEEARLWDMWLRGLGFRGSGLGKQEGQHEEQRQGSPKLV